jgi:spore germination cell wall hydrolase CwlJ-like protein
MTLSKTDVEALARTAYGEASNQDDAGRIGVISSVLNRAKDGHFPGGTTVIGVCLAHRQYDCWDEATADFKRTNAATLADPAYAACYGLALLAQADLVRDNTDNAVFYHDISRPAPPSAWGAVKFTVQHGRLKFYAKG